MTYQTGRSGGGMRTSMFTLAVVGTEFLTVDLVFITGQNAVNARSGAAEVSVTFINRRIDNDDCGRYRPTFEATAADGEAIDYTDGAWVSPKPHNVGEIIPGRVDWATGEIRNVSMMTAGSPVGTVFVILGGGLLFASLFAAGRMVKGNRQ